MATKLVPAAAAAAAGAAAVATCYRLVVTGALTLDLGWGRTTQSLGPLSTDIDAPPDVVFDLIAHPYLGRPTRAMAAKVEVLERGHDMVLAAHFTPLPGGLVATTTETVRLSAPDRVEFRLVRGPVPYLREVMSLRQVDAGTRLEYIGELGTDLWAAGRWWGTLVARKWEATVQNSIMSIQAEAERRQQHANRRGK